ncbi:hypothetical protein [Marinobacter mobilis]|uniref:hypothetical protein n=1 Tax=Marinobacter mobilis TaxID=488533 RepID=UPI0035C6E76C
MSKAVPQWHLVGNGPGRTEIRQNERIIRFNQPLPSSEPSTLVVSNGREKGISRRFIIEGQQPPYDFEHRLNETANALESRLGAHPSAGLTALCVLSEEFCNIRINCMNLLPSIARPEHLANRKPLACYFHNWLGERRIILPWVHQLNWPGFWLSFLDKSKLEQRFNPYPSLMSMPFIERREGLTLIRYLAELPQACWTTNATGELLTHAENLFFLSRDVHETPNWWLFDYEASELMARIHFTLAVAQQSLLSPAQALPESL